MNWVNHTFNDFSIRLPTQQLIGNVRRESDYYGAKKNLCEYANLSNQHYRLDHVWQHGWIRDRLLVDPAIVLTSRHANEKDQPFLVTNREQEEFLKGHGYPMVQAVGLPIIYSQVPEQELKRLPNSLLVMPMHSLETAKRKSDFDEYAKLINDLRKEFDFVLVCLHYACIRNNFWINEFDKYNIPWIEGGNVYDQNALTRLGALFSQFEYVTTNGYGSHLPYSTYFGTKTSIYGEFPPRNPEDYIEDPFFKRFPRLLKTYFPLLQEDVIREDLPFLFCHPKEAKKHTAWAEKELGVEYKMTRKEARKILKDDRFNQLKSSTINKTRHMLSQIVPEGVKQYYRSKASGNPR
uniref:Uncharacterized protein n=1 Tax=Roseihalotalea indica TaxID=2867963 RepID=A0AA49Q0B6_9BACT|nr:hypothetical protein K4G66_15215 [Tunicatimonas sp. TK19036]